LQVVFPDQFYAARGTAQSRTIDATQENLYRASLTANFATNGGTVQFYLTNNGGAEWFPVTSGVAHTFTTTGSDLRWKAVLAADPLWPRSPEIFSLRIEYSTQAPLTDAYEPDNACPQARPIAVDGAPQAHTFHQNADADWVWFEVTAGRTYIIQTANTQPNADTTLQLHAACPQPPLFSDENAFGSDAQLTFQAPFSGSVFVKVTNHDPAIFGPDTGYELSVRTFQQAPIAVIVAGHNNAFTLQNNINHAADLAFRALMNSGVPKANLRYLGPDLNRDVDGNGLFDDLAALATPTNVRQAVQDWARQRGVGLEVPFFLVLVDHGFFDQFLADGSQGRISAADLNLWLSNLEATSGADQINVILEACKAGSFIDSTDQGPARISGRNRVIIASTSSSLDAYPSSLGAYFSDAFWSSVGQNQDLKTAFEQALRAVQATGLNQTPWLDDNGDGLPNSGDGALAYSRGLGIATVNRGPVIDSVQIINSHGSQATIQAQVRDDRGAERVWAVIYPPGFTGPAPVQDETTPSVNVPSVNLVSAGGGRFSAVYSGFNQPGQYRLVIYAQDADGNQAFPMTTYLSPGNPVVPFPVFLPALLNKH
jgi:hypothetical protein